MPGRNLQTCRVCFLRVQRREQRRRSVSLRVVDFDHRTVLTASFFTIKWAISLMCLLGICFETRKTLSIPQASPERVIFNPHFSDADTDAWRNAADCPGSGCSARTWLKVLTLDLTLYVFSSRDWTTSAPKTPLGYQRLLALSHVPSAHLWVHLGASRMLSHPAASWELSCIG